ncbi:MAG: hypothetical protein R3357_13140 [Burkholderiales bacterium]|nr:hypothetical protein [Burkholderiales bacterium]
MRRRRARREDLGLSAAEFAVLRRLDAPHKIQRFLTALRQNFEPDGDSCRPVRVVLRSRSAHCIEAAMLAAAALWVHGEPPLLLDLRAEQTHDVDHVVALYRRNGCWGALAKANGPMLRGRDPVYRSLRELAMSYFHEYTNRRGRRTLREYSRPYDLRGLDPALWVAGEDDVWDLVERLDAHPHTRLLGPRQAKTLSRPDAFMRRVGALLQYRRPRRRKIS